MHTGFIFVVENESLRLIPRCVVGQANNRIMRLHCENKSLTVLGRQGFFQSLPQRFRHFHLFFVPRLHQDVDLIGQCQILQWPKQTPGAQEQALTIHGTPPHKGSPNDGGSSSQGSQFNSNDFIDILKKHGINISMNGRGRWMDNVFIERL